ncbi:hypothetical protein [Lewinella sp. W8]|uniref:hypothetical protein n=1 Tax=Lewinella sp. W8 TaxID=2528208 RepID=UPI001067DED5|nr:hypothetical protein [Lewinella sp. W8]MTB49590.1 hypothetical protein [Lewinella sp. W8]
MIPPAFRYALRGILLFIALLPLSLFAQPIQVNVVVPNPPPIYWDAYLEFEADILVILTNVSRQTQEIKLVPNLTSDRGIEANFRPDFQPLSPIVLGGGESLNLTYRDLRAIFGTPTEADVQLSGISFDRLFESETIPEGNYTLCVEARDFATNVPLSNNFGCDVFFVQQHEPPLIIYPNNGEQIEPLEPQFLNFLWSISGLPGQTRYRFELFDLDDLGLSNPNDAFILDAVRPYFEQDDLLANTLAYDLALPPLIAGHNYAVQVTAYDPEGRLLFAQGGRSQIHTFLYHPFNDGGVEPGPGVVVAPENDNPNPGVNQDGPNDFQDNNQPQQTLQQFACPPAGPAPTTNPYPSTISPGAEITVGDFTMELLTGGGISPIAGSGRMLIPALNTYVNVSFTGLDVNTELQVYGQNDVIRTTDGSGNVPLVLLQDLTEGNVTPEDLPENVALQLADYVDNQGNWLDPDAPGINPAINLPAGIAGQGMDLILTGMEFRPEGATLSAYVRVELPEAQGSRRLILLGKGMCLTQGGLGQDADLILGNNPTFSLSPGVDLTFIGGEGHTSVSWSENGIGALNVDAELSFAQNIVATDGQPLVASFTASVNDYQDWTASVTLNQDSWQVPGLNDFELTLMGGNIVYDHSAISGPPNFDLPGSHPLAGNENLWQGVYIPGLEFSFPEGLDAEVNIEDIILDGQGLWMDVDANGNLLSINEGEVGGWPLAIDHLGLDVRASSVESASFGGQIRLPISETLLDFTAPIGNGGNFSFAVELGEALDVDMWVAEISLAGNSSVGVTKQGNTYLPEAVLNGELTIGWTKGDNQANSAVGSFNIPGIEFQNFTITGGNGTPQLSGQFGLDLENVGQGGMADFPLQLNEINIDLEGEEVGIQFDLGLKLTEMANGFEGATAFSIIGDWDAGQKRFTYDRTQLDEISIDADMGVIELEGSIIFFNDHETYGDGFDGAIDIGIVPIDVGLEMRLMVGKMPQYRYFMIDALTKFPGIPLGPSGLGLYGLGGGFYANMQRQYPENAVMTINDVPDDPDLGGEIGETGSGATYVPVQGNFGFMARAVLGLYPVSTAMNADLEFGIDLGPNFNVNSMYMSGDAYVMQNMADRDGGALISGGADLIMNFQEKEYTFGGDLSANILNFLELDVSLEAFYSPNDWHFYLGRWTPGHQDPLTDPNRIKFEAGFDFAVASVKTGINSYFMMGTDLPAGLPPKPLQIQSIFNEDGENLPSQNLLPVLTTTKGFAFGMINYFDLSFKALIFRLDVEYLMGLDVLMENKEGQECNMNEFGINQWYGKGQAYAYLGIEGAVEGKLFGKKRKFTFAEIEAAAAIDFAGPKPVWLRGKAALRGEVLGGLIEFDTKVEFEHGKKVVCSQDGNNIFDDIPIVEEFDPTDGASGQSIFTHPQVAFNFPRGAFPIDEESDTPGEYLTRYYGYEIIGLTVKTKEQGGNWKTHLGGTGSPQYDDEGYSCLYDLPNQLPEFSQVELTLRVRGQRYNSNDPDDVAENFEVQTYTATFQTGAAPDYILANSIDRSKPFHRQLNFLEDEGGNNGYLNFWHEQSNSLFRTTPTAQDGLSTQGHYTYVVRFKDLSAGTAKDVNPFNLSTAGGGGMSFPIPKNFLKPKTVYELDVLRIYHPPNSTPDNNTSVVMADLGIDGQSGGGGGGGNLQILAMPQQQQNNVPNAGMMQVAMFQNNANQGMNVNVPNQFQDANNDPGVDPPFEGGNGQILSNEPDDGPGFGGPNDFQSPGGNMDGLKYASRRLEQRGLVGEEVSKSLMQQKLYFRTSMFTDLASKMNQVKVKNLNQSPAQTHMVDTDNLHQFTDGTEVKTPYLFLESDEGFDRFESQYWQWNYHVSDGENHNAFKLVKYTPFVTFEGREDWRSQTFMSEGDNGLFRPPFGNSDNSWCMETFYDPDDELNHIDGGLPKPNAPLQSGNPNPYAWFGYQMPAPDFDLLEDPDRYEDVAPFGTRKNRELPPPNGSYAYQFELPTIEFLQHPTGSLPNDLGGVSVQKNNTYLTNAVINAAQPPEPPDPPGPGQINELWVGFDPPSPGILDVVPNFNLMGNGGIQPPNSGGGSPAVGGTTVLTGNPSFIPLVDFTEWMTYQDYVLFRRLVDEGVLELAILSETFEAFNSPHYNHDVDCSDDLGPMPNQPDYNPFDPGYDFYLQYYKQIRAYFKSTVIHSYFPYPARPEQEGFFRLGGKNFSYQVKSLNNE